MNQKTETTEWADNAQRSRASANFLRSLPVPEPAAGVAAYEAQLERAFAFDARRRVNYEKYLRARMDRGVVDYLPIKLDIENVSRCNFRCTMCQVSDWHKGQRAADMSVESFVSLLEQQYGVIEIKLQGMGEPLMQGDPYLEMLRHAREREIWVRTTTNASLLHLRDNYRRLIDADPNEVQISIDGADAATFESIRRGSMFERVIANCKLINAYCRQLGAQSTKMWVVVQQANRHQLPAFVELAAEAGFTSLAFSLDLTNWGQEKWSTALQDMVADDAFNEELCCRLIERSRALGVRIGFWNVTDKYSWRQPETLCPWPFERVYVSSDMRVVPCCTIANPEVVDLGDASDLSEVWQSDSYEKFRRDHREARIPRVCQGCYRDEQPQSQ